MEDINLLTAGKLRTAGLRWEPRAGDRIAVPDRGLDDQVFVINNMTTLIEMLNGMPAVTFHGTSEWALDYLYLGEVVWLPSEGQLRDMLQSRLEADGTRVYDLIYVEGSYTCRFGWHGEPLAFSAASAGQAYAAALLHLLAEGGG